MSCFLYSVGVHPDKDQAVIGLSCFSTILAEDNWEQNPGCAILDVPGLKEDRSNVFEHLVRLDPSTIAFSRRNGTYCGDIHILSLNESLEDISTRMSLSDIPSGEFRPVNVNDLRCQCVSGAHRGCIMDMTVVPRDAFSDRENALLVTCSWDNSVKIWDTRPESVEEIANLTRAPKMGVRRSIQMSCGSGRGGGSRGGGRGCGGRGGRGGRVRSRGGRGGGFRGGRGRGRGRSAGFQGVQRSSSTSQISTVDGGFVPHCARYCKQLSLLATSEFDLVLWDLHTLQESSSRPLTDTVDHNGTDICFVEAGEGSHSLGHGVFVGCRDGSARFFSTNDGALSQQPTLSINLGPKRSSANVESCLFDPDSQLLYLSGTIGTGVYDVRQADRRLETLRVGGRDPFFSESSSLLGFCGSGRVFLWGREEVQSPRPSGFTVRPHVVKLAGSWKLNASHPF